MSQVIEIVGSTESTCLCLYVVGLYKKCVTVEAGGDSVLTCTHFLTNFGQSNDIYPTAWQVWHSSTNDL